MEVADGDPLEGMRSTLRLLRDRSSPDAPATAKLLLERIEDLSPDVFPTLAPELLLPELPGNVFSLAGTIADDPRKSGREALLSIPGVVLAGLGPVKSGMYALKAFVELLKAYRMLSSVAALQTVAKILGTRPAGITVESVRVRRAGGTPGAPPAVAKHMEPMRRIGPPLPTPATQAVYNCSPQMCGRPPILPSFRLSFPDPPSRRAGLRFGRDLNVVAPSRHFTAFPRPSHLNDSQVSPPIDPR